MASLKISAILTRSTTLALALLLLAGCQTTNVGTTNTEVAEGGCLAETPLSTDLSISPPSADVPDDIARFSGVWGNGKWDDKLCHTLAVVSIDADGNAEAIYSYGTYSGWDIRKAEYFKPNGKIADGKLTLETFRNGAKAVYWFSGDVLKGSYTRNGNTSYVTLSRVNI
ncbi:MAG: hypothetical protein H8E36_15440 [Rhodospirillaceae bacterium]|nr:hypothetical protein [Rhodospirillaceae bacterium]